MRNFATDRLAKRQNEKISRESQEGIVEVNLGCYPITTNSFILNLKLNNYKEALFSFKLTTLMKNFAILLLLTVAERIDLRL